MTLYHYNFWVRGIHWTLRYISSKDVKNKVIGCISVKLKISLVYNKSFYLFSPPPPLPPPNVLSPLFLCHTQEFIRCYHVGDSQYFQCYEPFPKHGQEGHGRLIHWTENQAPKYNHVREQNYVITDCVIFLKTFCSLFHHVFSFKLGLDLLRILWQLVISRQRF